MTPSVTRRSRKPHRGPGWAPPPVLSSPDGLSVVGSWTGSQGSGSPPVCRGNGSLLLAPPFPRTGPDELGSPPSPVLKALRLPTPHPGRFWFATGFRAVLRGSCSPKRSRADGGAARAWAVWSAGGPVPAGVRVDGVGSHRFPGDPSRAFALLQDPGRISGPSPKRSHQCCPRAQHDEGFSG